MFFIFKALHNPLTGSVKYSFVHSVAFNDSGRVIYVNDIKLAVDPLDYECAKNTLLNCMSGNVSIVHEDVLTDGNASSPLFDVVYESIRLVRESAG